MNGCSNRKSDGKRSQESDGNVAALIIISNYSAVENSKTHTHKHSQKEYTDSHTHKE